MAHAARRGDASAVEALCDSMRGMIEALAFEHEGALSSRDLTQEGLLAVLSSLHRYRPERGPLTPYMRPRIRGAMLEASAREAREESMRVAPAAETLTPESECESREDMRRILAMLSPIEQAALALRADGLEWREVARRMGMSAAAAKQAGWRAMKRIRNRT
jgi:RNA polymerase sigma factor (sigma-70 family)